MKTSTLGIASAAILMVVAGVGFGIAQAAGNQSYDPMLKFGDQDVNPYIQQDVHPYAAEDMYRGWGIYEWGHKDLEEARGATEENMYRVWGNDEWGYDHVAEVRGPVETAGVPEISLEESWMKEYGND